MHLYLSSYKIGNKGEQLKAMISPGKKIGYIPNAGDYSHADPLRYKEVMTRDLQSLEELGIETRVLDLRKYFGKKDALRNILRNLGGVWVRGGNTFILRQAMKLSGFDELLIDELMERKDFVYGGYSAAGCVLSPSLKCYTIVDDPSETPYEGWKEVLWDGLGILDFAFMPHFNSNHPESADVDKEIALCSKNNIPFKALRDGEVLIIKK